MNGVLDKCLVGVALFAGFGYAIYSLGPKALRASLLTVGAALLRRIPAAGVRGIADRLAAAAGKAGSCGGCDNCGSNGPASDRSGASGAAPQKAAESGSGDVPEIRIPLADIGKRRDRRPVKRVSGPHRG